jgi:hypothetical protein
MAESIIKQITGKIILKNQFALQLPAFFNHHVMIWDLNILPFSSSIPVFDGCHELKLFELKAEVTLFSCRNQISFNEIFPRQIMDLQIILSL